MISARKAHTHTTNNAHKSHGPHSGVDVAAAVADVDADADAALADTTVGGAAAARASCDASSASASSVPSSFTFQSRSDTMACFNVTARALASYTVRSAKNASAMELSSGSSGSGASSRPYTHDRMVWMDVSDV